MRRCVEYVEDPRWGPRDVTKEKMYGEGRNWWKEEIGDMTKMFLLTIMLYKRDLF